jgi:DNA (cytosine-5)-methyltransferase 1
MENKSKAIDLCCGLGGISLAARQLGIKPILGVDICVNALKSYKNNFPKADTINLDLTSNGSTAKIIDYLKQHKIDTQDLYVVSGPPCQGFSVAGKREVSDPRNNLIVNIAKLITTIKPKAAIVENVSFIKNKKYSRIINRFKKQLTDAKYFIEEFELNAQDYGVPQRRRRVFFLITAKKISQADYVKFFESQKKKAPKISQAFVGLPLARVRPDDYSDELSVAGFYNHFAMQHSEKVKQKIARIKPGKGPFSYRKLNPDNYAPTLVAGHRAPPVHYKYPRSITTREAARIQSLPDSFRIYGNFGSQIQQVANAVPPKLAKVVLKTLMTFVER